jgi:uncharacterized membrane protein YhdT
MSRNLKFTFIFSAVCIVISLAFIFIDYSMLALSLQNRTIAISDNDGNFGLLTILGLIGSFIAIITIFISFIIWQINIRLDAKTNL